MLNLKTIYERVILVLIIAGVIFLMLFTYLFIYTVLQEKQVYNEAKLQFNNEVVSLLDLNSESLRLSVNDFTSSDDLVNFTQSRSTKWYNEHIVGGIKNLKVDYICVYDTAFNIIGETSSLKILSRRFIPREAVLPLEKMRYANFFLQTTEGLVEVSGASIHPTSDRLHTKTKPSGYTFMVRLWDDSFKTKLSRITSSKVEFRQLPEQEEKTGINSMTASINLTDWNHKTVAQIIFSRGFNLNFRTSKFLLYITVIAFIIGIIVFVVFARLWIYRPLDLIRQVLVSENKEAITKLKDSPGEYHYIGTLFEDYFNQRQTLEQAKIKAEESDNLKSAFLSNIAHEIRTPMHGILGFADLLKTTSLSGEQMQDYIAIIEKSSVRMLNTITDLIEISKIESGQSEIKLAMVDVKLKLEKMYAIFRPEADKKGIQLSIVNMLESDQPIVRTDREMLETIFSKLLKNAIKYTNTGSIEIGYEYEDKFLKFFVKDTGIGIEKDKYQSVFDRFIQADNSLSKNYEGFGLGLSITKAYVEMLGGTIWVESEPGEGSVFYFTIPYKS
jgi:signal transduction histidine kinase